MVELDGIGHHTSEGRLRDGRRDAFLRKKGFDILRFTNQEVIDNITAVVARIKRRVKAEAESVVTPP